MVYHKAQFAQRLLLSCQYFKANPALKVSTVFAMGPATVFVKWAMDMWAENGVFSDLLVCWLNGRGPLLRRKEVSTH